MAVANARLATRLGRPSTEDKIRMAARRRPYRLGFTFSDELEEDEAESKTQDVDSAHGRRAKFDGQDSLT